MNLPNSLHIFIHVLLCVCVCVFCAFTMACVERGVWSVYMQNEWLDLCVIVIAVINIIVIVVMIQ